MTVTTLEHAKAMRAMGAPLNTRVKDRGLSPQSKKKIGAVYKATDKFGEAVLAWAANARRFASVCRAWGQCDDRQG